MTKWGKGRCAFAVATTIALLLFWLASRQPYRAEAIIEIPVTVMAPTAELLQQAQIDQRWKNVSDIRKNDEVLSAVVRILDLGVVWDLSEAEAARRLRRSLRVKPIDNTDRISIQARGRNPTLVVAIANTVAEEFCAHRRETGEALWRQFHAEFEQQIAAQRELVAKSGSEKDAEDLKIMLQSVERDSVRPTFDDASVVKVATSS